MARASLMAVVCGVVSPDLDGLHSSGVPVADYVLQQKKILKGHKRDFFFGRAQLDLGEVPSSNPIMAPKKNRHSEIRVG